MKSTGSELDKNKICQALENYDKKSFRERTNRLYFIARLMRNEEYWALPFVTMQYFEDAKICFLGGAFAATTVMCQMVAEELIRSVYRMAGKHKLTKYGTFVELLRFAYNDRLLSDREFKKLDGLRRIRNTYVHTENDLVPQVSRWTPLDKRGKTTTIVRAERDAKQALKTLIGFLNQTQLIWRK